MSQNSDGMNYAPQGKPTPVVKPGEFVFAATHLNHGHIYGQCNGLTEAGAQLKWVYDSDPKNAKLLLIREIPQFGNSTCLQIAKIDNDQKFLAHMCVQELLVKLWFNRLSPEESILKVK